MPQKVKAMWNHSSATKLRENILVLLLGGGPTTAPWEWERVGRNGHLWSAQGLRSLEWAGMVDSGPLTISYFVPIRPCGRSAKNHMRSKGRVSGSLVTWESTHGAGRGAIVTTWGREGTIRSHEWKQVKLLYHKGKLLRSRGEKCWK